MATLVSGKSVFLSGIDKLVLDCFFEAKLKSVATVIAINRKSSQTIAKEKEC